MKHLKHGAHCQPGPNPRQCVTAVWNHTQVISQHVSVMCRCETAAPIWHTQLVYELGEGKESSASMKIVFWCWVLVNVTLEMLAFVRASGSEH